MRFENSSLILNNPVEEGSITWKSPSNIALVKYWGKYGNQLPANPSISITLNNAYTKTTLKYTYTENLDTINLVYYFEGVREKAFEEKVLKYLKSLLPVFPFLNQLTLEIESSNTFPHSAGIASSASSMSALALCLCSLEEKFFGMKDDFYSKASYLGRLGSGSACRSLYDGLVSWGESEFIDGSSNEFGLRYNGKKGADFNHIQDAILIVDSKKKDVSSRAGHGLMKGHDFAQQRFLQAGKNLGILLDAIKSNDWGVFAEIVENEALSLHSMMMTSNPSFLLMKPETLIIIEKLRRFREQTGSKICFTLDAGPNVHVLFPDENSDIIKEFIENELKPHCENQMVLYDHVGNGPVRIPEPENMLN